MSSTQSAAGARSILNAAVALFAEEGYGAVSVAAIAVQAGVSKANVFHHFESKEALYLAVMKAASAEHADYAEELYQQPGSSADKVRKLIEFEIHNMLENHHRTRLILRESSESCHQRVRKVARTVFQRNFTAVVNIFEQGRDSGEFRAGIDPAASAMLLGGATHFFFSCRDALSEFRESNGLEAPQVYASRISNLILSGVLAKPQAAGSTSTSTSTSTKKSSTRRKADK